ncbi:SRPBCC family protein [bacterium]|nr:SRPBCC family protein [bacterium]
MFGLQTGVYCQTLIFKDSTMKITIETTITAGTREVWDCYTDPAHITSWNFASEDWCCPNAENDLQVGGKYKARMEAKDGSMGFDFEATYAELVFGERFTYTLEDGRKVSVFFENLGNKTKVTTTFDAETENSIEMQKNGWQSILDNFKQYVENR